MELKIDAYDGYLKPMLSEIREWYANGMSRWEITGRLHKAGYSVSSGMITYLFKPLRDPVCSMPAPEDHEDYRQLMQKYEDRRQILIEELPLSVRSTNVLMNNGIRTVGKLTELTANHLLRIPNLGPKSVAEICGALSWLGLSFTDDTPEWAPPLIVENLPPPARRSLRCLEPWY